MAGLNLSDLKEVVRLLRESEKASGQYRMFYGDCPVSLQSGKARNHAIIRGMLSVGVKHSWKPGTVKLIYAAYQKVNDGSLRPKTQNYKAFSRWLKNVNGPHANADQVICDCLKTKPRGSAKRRAPVEAESVVKKYFLENYTDRRIAEKIITEHAGFGYWNKAPLSWVKKTIATNPELKSIALLYRKGFSAHRNEIMTPQYRLKPEYPLSLVQIDGTPLAMNMHGVDENGKPCGIMPNVFTVVDVMSSMIVGYSIDESENNWMILRALESAVRNTGHLPKELFADNTKSYHKQEFKTFIKKAEKYGCMFKKDRTKNPRSKASGESSHNRLQRMMMEDPYFFGQGIRTGSRKPDEYTLIMRHPSKRLSKQDTEKRIRYWVDLYNNTPMRDGLTPKQKFYSKEIKYGIKIADYEIPILFWKHTILTVKQGLVKLTVNKSQFIFELNSPQEKHLLNWTKVNVYYDEDDLSEVVISDLETDLNPITCKRQRMPQVATAEQSDEDIQILKDRVNQNKREREYRLNEVAKISELPNIAQSKGEEQAARNMWLNKLKNDPVAKTYIPVLEEETIDTVSDNEDDKEVELPLEKVTSLSRWDYDY